MRPVHLRQSNLGVARAEAWQAVLRTAPMLYTGGVRWLGRLAFVDDGLLDARVREARQRRPATRARSRQYVPPGPVLRRLAVDRRLRRAVSRAFGFAVEPAYVATYMYD